MNNIHLFHSFQGSLLFANSETSRNGKEEKRTMENMETLDIHGLLRDAVLHGGVDRKRRGSVN
jgi:hypothetical protein